MHLFSLHMVWVYRLLLPPTVPFSVKELKSQRRHAQLRHSLCGWDKKKTPPQFSVGKLDFHQLKLVGLHVVTIKCHQPAASVPIRQSAARSSLLWPRALATLAATPTTPSLSPRLSFSPSLFFLPGCSDPPFLTTLPPLSVTPEALRFHSVSADWRPQCWQSSRPSEDTSNRVPPLCC